MYFCCIIIFGCCCCIRTFFLNVCFSYSVVVTESGAERKRSFYSAPTYIKICDMKQMASAQIIICIIIMCVCVCVCVCV